MSYRYEVYRQVHGGRVTMFKTPSRKEAITFYNKHKRAIGIQIYHNNVTAGVLQPGEKESVRVNGKIYRKGYMGPHTKRGATALVNSFRKDKIKAVKRKSPKGWQVYVRFKR